jgi:CheY-like chemotaxis protein
MVALTGYGKPADRDKALQSGFDRHLVKPVSLKDLSEVIGEHACRLQRRQAI